VQQMRGKQPGVLLNEQIESGLVQAVAGTIGKGTVTALTGAAPMQGDSFCYPHTVLQTSSGAFRTDETLQHEHFGPVTLFVQCESEADLLDTLQILDGNLTGTVHAAENETELAGRVYDVLREKVGRLIWNGYPTGVEVTHAMQHGGPYPATTAPATTSVGMTAIKRFMRPVAFQDLPDVLLPDALKNANPLGILRLVNDIYSREPMG
jgi:2,5-dioxopentanoate dehydrogenase